MMYEWMFFNTFTKEEFSREKSVVLKELERGDASIPRQVYYANQAHFYDYHPMRYPVIGYSKLVKETTIDSIKAFLQYTLRSSNMVLVIGGDLSNLDMLTQIKDTFGTVPASQSHKRRSLMNPSWYPQGLELIIWILKRPT